MKAIFRRNKAYSKKELATLYNPDITAEAAVNMLRRWILRNEKLRCELEEAGYEARFHLLTPLQVNIITRYLGEP